MPDTNHLLHKKSGKPLNIAHRGVAKGATENTLAGVANSIAVGADGVEVDLQQTADGKLIIFHDEKIKLNGRQAGLSDLTLEQVRSMDLGRTALPLLEEVLCELRNTDLLLILDIKSMHIAENLINEVLRHETFQHILIASFDPRCLLKLRKMPYCAVTALTIGFSRVALSFCGLVLTLLALLFPVRFALYLKAGVVLCSDKRVTKRLVARAHDAGILVFAWPSSGRLNPSALIEIGVDGILSYCPEKFPEEVC